MDGMKKLHSFGCQNYGILDKADLDMTEWRRMARIIIILLEWSPDVGYDMMETKRR